MTGRLAGQTINDRFLAARHSLAGQGLAKSVCKATTEEMIGPKKKHLDCKFVEKVFYFECKDSTFTLPVYNNTTAFLLE